MNRTWINNLLWLCVVGVAVFFFLFVVRHAINVPYFDDFALMINSQRILDAPTWSEKFSILLSRHNFDHRLTVVRLGMLLSYFTLGEFNLRALSIAGSLAITATFWMMGRMLVKRDQPTYWLPLAFILFTPIYYPDIFIASYCWQHSLSVGLTVWMFYLLARSGQSASSPTWLCFPVGFLVVYSNGNGVVAVVMGLFILYLQRRYRLLAGWLVFAVVIGLLYYFPREKPGHDPTPAILADPMLPVRNFLAFTGSTVYWLKNSVWQTFLMGGVLALLGIGHGLAALLGKLPEKVKPVYGPFWVAFWGWTLLTGAGAAVTRIYSNSLMIVDYYQLFAILALGAGYATIVNWLPDRWRLKFTYGASVLLALYWLRIWHIFIPDISHYRKNQTMDVFNHKHHMTVSGKLYPFNPLLIKQVHGLVDAGLYRYPETFLDPIEPRLLAPAQPPAVPLSLQVDTDTAQAYGGLVFYKLINSDVPIPEGRKDDGLYVILKSDQNTYINAPRLNRAGKKDFVQAGQFYRPGFTAEFYQDNVAPGRYRVCLLRVENGRPQLLSTNQEVDIRF